MTSRRFFLFGALVGFIGFVICVALHEYIYSFDPYGWAVPGEETVRSRQLFLQRVRLYRVAGVISFTLALVFSGAAWISKRRERRIN